MRENSTKKTIIFKLLFENNINILKNNSFFSINTFQLILFSNNINSANNSDPQPIADREYLIRNIF